MITCEINIICDLDNCNHCNGIFVSQPLDIGDAIVVAIDAAKKEGWLFFADGAICPKCAGHPKS